MRVVITGSGGQLAAAMRATIPAGVDATWLGRTELDITNPAAVARNSALSGCDVLINTAAHTAVDAAEDEEERATAVNDIAPGNLARRCEQEGVHLVHLSTDYVFGSSAPRRPLTPADPTEPDTVYGRTKLAGEARLAGFDATILRTAWVYSGNTLPTHRDFVSTMLRLEQSQPQLQVVDDQHGSPTYAVDLARVVWQAAAERPGGIRHAVGRGSTTWFGLASAVFEEIGADPARITPVTSAEFPTRATRPAWSVLESDYVLPEWRSAVGRAVAAKL